MYSIFEKKNSHCQQQAINTLQSIFPSINLPQFSKQSSVWQVLQKSAQKLPRPGLSDITLTISNMKTVVDSQQLKIQKNMLQIQRHQQIIMSSTKISDNKSLQQSTRIKKHTHRKYQIQEQNQDSLMRQQQYEVEVNQDYEKYEIKRNLFFAQNQQVDYLAQNQNSEIRQDQFYDQDVKKYLSFDF